ncbi:hypothetical protein LPJ56_003785 [Coemansia sp. RSA 2599]|nr:hypothetical protein LPJ56_003785 [Coemansia sp. RSA 2599]
MDVDPQVVDASRNHPDIFVSAAAPTDNAVVIADAPFVSEAETAKPQRLALRRPPGLSLSISSATTPVAPTIPLPAIPLPALPANARIDHLPAAQTSQPEIVTDYFGCVQGEISANSASNSNSSGNSCSGSGSSNSMVNHLPADYLYASASLAMPSSGLGTGMLDVFVGPPTSDAADWRRSVLGHLDASGEFSPIRAHIAPGIVSTSNTAPTSPSTTTVDGGARSFATGNPALSSPRVK